MSTGEENTTNSLTKSELVENKNEEVCRESSSDNESLESIDPGIKDTLTDLYQEGILENVLPYLTTKKNSNLVDIVKKCPSQESLKKAKEKSGSESSSKESLDTQSIELQPKSIKEIEIHVCDELRNLKKDFKCSRKLLLSKMGYFGEVTTGLEDMDINVYCDINVFEWIMTWVKKDETQAFSGIPELIKTGPELDATNVMPILVSSSLLQMEPLIQICLKFCKDNINDIMTSSVNLTGLNDNILTRLGKMFSNQEVENITDQKNKFKFRVYCNLIMSLTHREPETWKGHFSSLASIYKCLHCKKFILHQHSLEIPCTNTRMKMKPNGEVIALHSRDKLWKLTSYIESLKAELKSWRNVYWRLWAECHFLYCSTCHSYYSLYQENTCVYHPNEPEFFTIEENRIHPVGKYLCCGAKAFKFESIFNFREGCKKQKHTPTGVEENKEILDIFHNYKDVIFSSSPAQPTSGKRKTTEKTFVADKKCSILQCLPYKNKKGLLIQGMEKTNEESIRFAINSRVPARIKLALFPPKEVGWPKRHGHIEDEAYRIESVRDSPSATDYVTDSRRCPKSTYLDVIKKRKSKHKINGPINDDSIEDEDNESILDGCCLPLQEINKEEDDINKPVQYLRKEERPSKHTKLCGLTKSQWVSKFSTRYNQDNQRNYEEIYFSLINGMLSRRIVCANILNEKIMYENLASSFRTKSTTHSRANMIYSSFAKYCSALTATARLQQSSAIWNSTAPLGGTYVRIEAKWREEENIPTSTLVSNQTSTQASTVARVRHNKPKPRRSECGLKWNIGHACGFGGENVYADAPFSEQDSRKRPQFWEFDKTTKELGYIPSNYLKIPKEMIEDKIRTLQVQIVENKNPDWVKLMELEEKWKNVLRLINTAERVPFFRKKLMRFLEKPSPREISPRLSETYLQRKSTTSLDIYTEDKKLIIDMRSLPRPAMTRVQSSKRSIGLEADKKVKKTETANIAAEFPKIHLPKIKKQ